MFNVIDATLNCANVANVKLIFFLLWSEIVIENIAARVRRKRWTLSFLEQIPERKSVENCTCENELASIFYLIHDQWALNGCAWLVLTVFSSSPSFDFLFFFLSSTKLLARFSLEICCKKHMENSRGIAASQLSVHCGMLWWKIKS